MTSSTPEQPAAPEQPATPPATPPPASPPPAAPPAPVAATAAPTYGGFWIRFLALFLDGIIIGVVSSALAPILGVGQIVTTTTGAGAVQINYTYNALGTLLGLLYFIGFWSFRGQTPGMIPFRLRVVRAADGSRPDWIVSLLRYVGLIISIIPLFLGLIWAAFDSRKQGWHDKIAGTLVIRDPA
jgi:uncharacterized RDD family membrane protein YckC